MRGSRISISALRACAAEGMTFQAAAYRLGCAPATVYRRALDFGISFRRQRKPHPRQNAIVAAIRDGAVTAPDIAAKLGWPRPLVSVALYQMHDRGNLRRWHVVMRGVEGRPPIRWALGAMLEAAE